jgi:hypothetical protein
MIDPTLKSSILRIFKYLITDEMSRERIDTHIESMWNCCIDEGAFGYSAHYEAIVWKLPDIFNSIRPLVKNEKDFERLIAATPRICKWMPYTSEEDQMGYTHYIEMYPLQKKVGENETFDGFIREFEEE